MRKWILLFLVLSGCSQSKGGGGGTKYLLPWRNAGGKYELQEVTIETLASPTELRGEAAEIYDKSVFSDAGFKGSIARPRLTKSGDVYIPLDAESAIAVAVYAQLDHLFKYERQQGTRGQIAWPRRVGVELNVNGPSATAHDNAHYFTGLDVMGLLPYSKSGVPVALNHGIVAHEHFHAHFQTQVMNVLSQIHDNIVTVSAVENLFYPFFNFTPESPPGQPLDPGKPRTLNNMVLRAWNEGLADLFAGIYTGQGDFFTASLPQLAAARTLNALDGNLLRGDDFRQIVLLNKYSAEQMVGAAYGQGTTLARLLYRLANNGLESPDAFSARILGALHEIPLRVSAQMDSAVINFEDVVPILLEGYPLNHFVCGALGNVLMKSTMNRNFSKCDSL